MTICYLTKKTEITQDEKLTDRRKAMISVVAEQKKEELIKRIEPKNFFEDLLTHTEATSVNNTKNEPQCLACGKNVKSPTEPMLYGRSWILYCDCGNRLVVTPERYQAR